MLKEHGIDYEEIVLGKDVTIALYGWRRAKTVPQVLLMAN